ncbi:prostaglandin reductase-3-like [Centruroides sculpturatus]|uniref:prostaglandin reductase-3-like n=1 Tax=Centruroides sculpturatus TaxID=218467 RepID=UPI000C6E41D1|nr:prostaglandin reductase-3-like [Centruroides sculpturatus]XP_023244807.1 prostaglandin reductase-3-like [Centruroides sculpturatus]XP_023244808.1 prostaglandin reductase-3-like [Centruroides sculpturatus]XP_023244809.1 prostaglandin reductase-3-like [Centruroides sculpturatus]
MAMTGVLPKTFRKLMVVKKSIDFREAVSIVTTPMPTLKNNEILVQNRYVGINASDIIRSAGKYNLSETVPFEVGFEGIGKIVAVGNDVKKYKKDDYILYIQSGAYSEYIVLPENEESEELPISSTLREPKPEYIAIAGASGLTAKLSLDKCGEMKTGETVLITAAAGGTGHTAVLLAKQKNCHVIGTCSTKEKASFLKALGCDRVVITKEEKLQDVLTSEYPNGVDVVFESIGGEFFTAALSSLAVGGRLIIIGFISGYKSGNIPEINLQNLPQILLAKSASVRGFYLFHYFKYTREAMKELLHEFEDKIDKIHMDDGKKTGKEFIGLEGIIDGVEYLHSTKSYGKIFVSL